MKYLVNYTREFVIAICVIICVIAISIMAVKSGDYLKMMGALVNDVCVLLGLYFNIPTSPQNSEHTIQMRLEKSKGEIEYGYFEDVDEDGEDLDEDEMNTEEINDGVNDEIPEDGDEDE